MFRRHAFSLLALIALWAIGVTFVAPARAAREPVDRIIAVIEDEAVFASDVEDVVRQMLFQTRESNPTEAQMRELRKQALESLINDALIVAEAARLDIDVTFQDVEERVNQALDENRRMLGGDDAFQAQLAREGFDEQSLRQLYRQQIKNRMLVERVLQTEMQASRREPSDEELHKFYDEHQSEIPMRPTVVHLQTILIGFSSSTAASDRARQRIDDIHGRAIGGADFADLAKAESDDPSAPNGGDLGFLSPEDLADPTLRALADSLGIGEISDPVLTPYGWHILQVVERNPDDDTVRLRHILAKVDVGENDLEEVFATANSVHDQLVAGASFDSLAARYSSDPNAGPTGDLGWLKVDDLPDFFRTILGGMKPGDISQVLREQTGFRIVKLLAREEGRRYAFGEIRGELVRLWQQEQAAGIYAEYVAKLRDKFDVDMKVDTY
jgi:peptidyl-prolyl cis-trans isomerase SurA